MPPLTKRRSDSSLPTSNSHKRRSLLDMILGRHKKKESTTKAMDPFDRYLESQKYQTREQVPQRPHTWPRSSAEESRSRPAHIPRLTSTDPNATWKILKRNVTSLRNSGVGYSMKDALNQKFLTEMHEKGHLEFLQRDACRERNASRRLDVHRHRTNYAPRGVVDETLHDVLMVASTPVVMWGNTHDIPIIVHTCVSEIVQRGLGDSSIFSQPNDEQAVRFVAGIFDCGPRFGDGFKVDKSRISTLASVLIQFLDNLEGPPVIHPMIFNGIKQWSASRIGQEHEKTACTIASNLLKFLPVANLSLVTYMLDFFLRILNFPKNAFQPGHIASLLGRYLIAGPMDFEDQETLVWLMTRWPTIVRDLYGDMSGNDAWGAASESAERVSENPPMPSPQVRWLAEQRQHTQADAYRDQIPRRVHQQHPQQRRPQQQQPQQPHRPSIVPTTNYHEDNGMTEHRTEERHLEIPVEHASSRASSRCRSASFASSGSAYSNDDEEVADHKEVILRRLHPQTLELPVQGPRPLRPPISRLPTGISASDEVVVMPSTPEASSAVNLEEVLMRAPTTRFRPPDDDVMSVLNYYTGSDPEPGRNKQYQLGMLNARIFAAERQASILLRSQAHMIAHRRDRAGRRER